MRILLLKNKKVIDLENEQISSWNYIDTYYEIYYFNHDKSELIYESQIQQTFETLEDYCAYQTEEINELTSELTNANEYIRKLLTPFMNAKIPPEIFEKIENEFLVIH